jgi:hypothetical protein
LFACRLPKSHSVASKIIPLSLEILEGKLKSLLYAATALFLTACQSMSDVIPTGQDTYIVGVADYSGLKSDAEISGVSIKRGTEFCSKQNKRFELVKASSSGTQGWTAQQSQIIFRCV